MPACATPELCPVWAAAPWGPVQEVGTAGRRPWTHRRIATRTLGNTFVFPSGFVRRPARSTAVPVGPVLLGQTLRGYGASDAASGDSQAGGRHVHERAPAR